jgi:hypothetical protein
VGAVGRLCVCPCCCDQRGRPTWEDQQTAWPRCDLSGCGLASPCTGNWKHGPAALPGTSWGPEVLEKRRHAQNDALAKGWSRAGSPLARRRRAHIGLYQKGAFPHAPPASVLSQLTTRRRRIHGNDSSCFDLRGLTSRLDPPTPHVGSCSAFIVSKTPRRSNRYYLYFRYVYLPVVGSREYFIVGSSFLSNVRRTATASGPSADSFKGGEDVTNHLFRYDYRALRLSFPCDSLFFQRPALCVLAAARHSLIPLLSPCVPLSGTRSDSLHPLSCVLSLGLTLVHSP